MVTMNRFTSTMTMSLQQGNSMQDMQQKHKHIRSRCCRRLSWCDAVAFILLSEAVCGYNNFAFGFSVSRSRRDGRYFKGHLVAPPLEPLSGDSGYYGSSHLPILYTNDPKDVSNWLADHASEHCVLGFDVESVPVAPWVRRAKFNGPATVQLATPQSSIVVQLVRKNGRPSRACAPILTAVMRDESIVKAGCSIDDDFLELRQYFGDLEARSRLDLCCIGTASDSPGLQRLTRCILGLNLPKSKKLSASDWSQVPLQEKQVIYSARDAWAGAAIVDKLYNLDPESFASAALAERLRSQQSLGELHRRRSTQKQAKSILTALRAQSKKNAKTFPSWKVEVIQGVVRANKPVKGEVFDVALLGFPTLGGASHSPASTASNSSAV